MEDRKTLSPIELMEEDVVDMENVPDLSEYMHAKAWEYV